MSTPPPQDAAVAHVVRCLRLNPMWQADEVLASRAKLHGVDVAKQNPYQAALDESARKAAMRSRVYKLRDEVWKAPLDELRKKVGRLRLESEPELAKIADRLRVIVEARAKLPQLAQRRDFDGDFFECFKQVLTGSVRQSAEMRERVAASFRDRKLKKRGLRMMKLLRREVPELAKLEANWFNQLHRQKGHASSGVSQSVGGGGALITGTGEWVASNWWVGVLLVIFLRALLRLAGSGSGD